MDGKLVNQIFDVMSSTNVEELMDTRDAIRDVIETGEERDTALLGVEEYLSVMIAKIQDTESFKKAVGEMMVNGVGMFKSTPGPTYGREANTPVSPNAKEKDPSGMDAHTPGAKLDAGKPLAGLVLGDFSRALQGVVDVGTFGQKKYSDSGWLKVPDGEKRYKDALYRHLLELEKTPLDANSSLPVLGHLCWNALAWLELVLRRQEMEPDSLRESINEDAGC